MRRRIQTCRAITPPTRLLSLTYLSSEEARNKSNSSIDSGSGSEGGCFELTRDAGTAGAFEGGATGWLSTGASLGSSVAVAMSSKRDVAASSLSNRLEHQVMLCGKSIATTVTQQPIHTDPGVDLVGASSDPVRRYSHAAGPAASDIGRDKKERGFVYRLMSVVRLCIVLGAAMTCIGTRFLVL